jgi:hypothetical protein
MKMELHEVELYGIGAATSSGKGMAAKLQLSFMDADAKLINHVNLDIFVPRDLKGTLADMQKAARANGIEVLKAALSALQNHDIPALEEMSKASVGSNIDKMVGGEDKTG